MTDGIRDFHPELLAIAGGKGARHCPKGEEALIDWRTEELVER